MIYKPGDIVVFKYPEKITWDDTKFAVSDGTLKINTQYKVAAYGDQSYYGGRDFGLSVCLITKKGDWWVGIQSVIPLKPKRALPDWF